MGAQAIPGNNNRISNFCLVEQFNRAIDTSGGTDCCLVFLAKKIANIALLIIWPLNILLLPFIALWNCFCSSETPVQANPPPPLPPLPPPLGGRVSPLPPTNSNQTGDAISGTAPIKVAEKFTPYYKTANGKLVAYKIVGMNTLKENNNPGEFNSDLGEQANEIRDEVNDRIMSDAAFRKNAPVKTIKEMAEPSDTPTETETEIEAAREKLVTEATEFEKTYGPTFGKLISKEFIATLQKTFPDSTTEIDQFAAFVLKFEDVNAFPFLRNYPGKLIAMDKIINDALGEGTATPPPIVGSTCLIEEDSAAAMEQLFHYMAKFPVEMTDKKLQEVKDDVAKFKDADLKKYLGDTAVKNDLDVFCSTKFGQKLFYVVYQWLNRELIAEEPSLILKDKELKAFFAQTLANPQTRADINIKNIQDHRFGVVCVQEASAPLIEGLAENFWPIERQREDIEGMDSLTFLHRELWEEGYEVIKFNDYPAKERKKLTMVVAKCKLTAEYFAFVSCHGDSTNPEDAKVQLKLVKEAFEELKTKYPALQLAISIDANTKKPADVAGFIDKAIELGFDYSELVPTKLSQRIGGTVMNSKVGLLDISVCDYLLVLSEKVGGVFQLIKQRVGYKKKQDSDSLLPNIHYPSDHFPRSATLTRRKIRPQETTTTEVVAEEKTTKRETQQPDPIPLPARETMLVPEPTLLPVAG